MPTKLFPNSWTQRITALYGDEGRNWLESLPQIIKDCERLWDIKVVGPFSNLSFNFVAEAQRKTGEKTVLKLGFPGAELTAEAQALVLFGKSAMVELIATDVSKGALLLEKLHPGLMLSPVDNNLAVTVAAELMTKIWIDPPSAHIFPKVTDWLKGLDTLQEQIENDILPIPLDLANSAIKLRGELLASKVAPKLLHGDLHHSNILSAERKPWLAIDPKGVIGDPVFEVGAFMQNPHDFLLHHLEAVNLVKKRIRLFSSILGFTKDRIWAWCYVQAVLATW